MKHLNVSLVCTVVCKALVCASPDDDIIAFTVSCLSGKMTSLCNNRACAKINRLCQNVLTHSYILQYLCYTQCANDTSHRSGGPGAM